MDDVDILKFVQKYGIFVVITLIAWVIRLQYQILARMAAPKPQPPAPRPGSLIDAAANAPVKTEKEDDEVEDNYDDPDFNLPPLVPSAVMRGRVEDQHGDAIYGTEARYDKTAYIGRVSFHADLELMDRRVYKNQFTLDIIKVKVITNEWDTEVNKIGWVSLDDTSFRADFDPERREVLE